MRTEPSSRLRLAAGFPGTRERFLTEELRLEAGEVVYVTSEDTRQLQVLFDCVAGHRPTALGTKHLDGQDVSRLNPSELARRGVALGSGRERVFPSLTVAEHFRLRLRAAGAVVGVEAAVEAAREAFSVLRAAPATVCGNFSGGQQQCVMLALALLGSPRVIVIHEPFLGLAPEARRQAAGVLAERAEAGAAVLLVSQEALEESGFRCGTTKESVETSVRVRQVELGLI